MMTSNLLDAEFKTLVIRVLNELTGGVDKLKTFNSIKKDMEPIKKNQSEIKDILTEINGESTVE